jgi:hypothetical protein
MKEKIIKNEKLVLRKDTITRLNSVQMQQLIGGIPPIKTNSGSCNCPTTQSGDSQNSNGVSCVACSEGC